MDPNIYKKYFNIEKDHWLLKVRRSIVFDVLKRYGKKENGAKILDFGCASGFFVGELAKNGYQSFGLDISPEAIELGRGRGIRNLTVVNGNQAKFPDNYFDSILLLDVLEHIENELPILEEMNRILCPGGAIVIMAPAFKFLWGVQDEVSRHYRRYRIPELVQVMRSAGNFEILKKSYFNTFLFVPIAVLRLASRILKPKRQSDFDINNKWLNKIFFSLFNAERKLLNRMSFPFGVSALLVLRKPAIYEKA